MGSLLDLYDSSEMLVIDGLTLRFIMEDETLQRKFVSKAILSPSVAVCRCSPIQKAQIVKLIKREGKICGAVGDGGNDVTMILESNCGIGLVGKEGR